MKRIWICLVVVLSLLAMPLAASACAENDCMSGAAHHDSIGKEKPGKDGKAMHAACQACAHCHALALPGGHEAQPMPALRQAYSWADHESVPGHVTGPLLKPPSRA
ncbi:MAG: hypothetical protein WDO70_08000 [Alphaproteobacteria bacterium]